MGRRHDLETIVDEAVRVFLERGYDGTSMDHIARAAGIGKATLYHHVSGKEELLRLGISRALDGYHAMLAEPRAVDAADPVARLRYVLRRTSITIAAFVPETALLIRARGNTPTERWALDQRRRLNGTLAELIDAAWVVTGRPPDLDSSLAARLIFGMTTSVVDWFRPGGGAIDPERLAGMVEQLVLPGLLPGD